MVAKPIFVMHAILFQQSFKFLFNEMSTAITNEGGSKIGEEYFVEQSNCHMRVLGGASNSLHPSRDIVI